MPLSGLGFDGFPPGARKTARHLTAPTIHLNGTSKQSLMNGYGNALDGLRNAYAWLAETAPHMRDYYVQPDGESLFKMAQEAHIARLKRIEDSIAEIEALGITVVDQGS